MTAEPRCSKLRAAAAGLAAASVLAACGADSADTASNSAAPVTVAEQPAPSSEAALAPSPSTVEAGPAEDPSALECVPGTWSADMPSFIGTFTTPGKPEYRSGTYVFTFGPGTGYSATGDDVTFRLSESDGFVDVHNSWQESGLWGAASDTMTFDEVMVAVGNQYPTSAAELSVVLDAPEGALIAIVGDSYTAGEAYGMVNGAMRTPPISSEGAAIQAVGSVDCSTGTMSLLVAAAGWKGDLTLTRN